MDRVAIVGPGGAGKTTFARELGRRTGIPVVHLDEQYWQPGWSPMPRDHWRAWQLDRFGAEDRWVADGNYSGTLDVRLSRADVVLVLNPGRWTRTFRCLRRTLFSWGRSVQAPGCPERLDPRFLRWVWRYDLDARPRLDRALDVYAAGAAVHELHSTAGARAFLAAVSAGRPPGG